MMTGKERLIELLKLLYNKSDEDHPLSTAQIVAYFEDQGVPTTRITVKSDIETLNNCGIEIYHDTGTQTKYHLMDRQFDIAELKLLIDAVESSKFITAKKSEIIVKKLVSGAGEYRAKQLERHLYTSGRIKPGNEYIFIAVDVINEAINAEKQISFLYYEYAPDKTFVPKHGGERYVFSPYAMLYNEDKYYVLGYSERKKKVISYRVDRMKSTEVLDKPIVPRPMGFNPVDFTVDVFKMFDGKASYVRLRCENKLMNYVIDRFGEDVKTTIVNENQFEAVVKVSVSQTFFACVFQFAGGIRIIEPASVKEQYRQMLEDAQN